MKPVSRDEEERGRKPMKRICVILIVLLLLIGTLSAKNLIINFKDGTQVIYNLEDINYLFFEERTSKFSTVAGEWTGDKGVQKVYINSNGVYSVQLNNGYSWSGSVKLDNGMLIIETPYPIPIEYFLNYNIPIEVAKEARQSVPRPDRWLFNIYSNGKVLRGQKETFYLTWSGNDLTSTSSKTRNSEWLK